MIHKNLKLKVCGMREAENIKQLAAINPDYIGFIFYPKSKRYADFLETSALKTLPSTTRKTGVFVNASYDDIINKIEQYKLEAIQLHGQESPEFCMKFKNSNLEVIKAFGIDSSFDFNILCDYENAVNYFLFDTKTEQHGGSGKTFDWAILNNYTLTKPYFLSGGLSSDNISEIENINDPRLYALDLNSKFELEPGLKDIEKLTTVFNEIRIPG